MIFEWDDFGCTHEISLMCQSYDCRDQLLRLREVNPKFKATLFAIPGEMTMELLNWCKVNDDWIELAFHGFFHASNYECEKMTYERFDELMQLLVKHGLDQYFVKGFRAPGWQISDGIYEWLKDNGWWVADQGYNDTRRPAQLNAYVNYNGQFKVLPKVGEPKEVEAYHGHVWNVGALGNEPNGIYEDFDKVVNLVENATEFKFISELFA